MKKDQSAPVESFDEKVVRNEARMDARRFTVTLNVGDYRRLNNAIGTEIHKTEHMEEKSYCTKEDKKDHIINLRMTAGKLVKGKSGCEGYLQNRIKQLESMSDLSKAGYLELSSVKAQLEYLQHTNQ